MTAHRLRLGARHAEDERGARHVRRDPDVPAARGSGRVRARGQGRQGSRRQQPAGCVPARPALRDVRIPRRAGARPSRASTSRSRRRCRSSSGTGCRSASRTTRTGASISRSRCWSSTAASTSASRLDTGNNLTVLDDPIETVEKLAPYTFNVHFKDMAAEETERRLPPVGGAARRGHARHASGSSTHPARQAGGALLARDDHARSARGAVPDGEVLVDIRRREWRRTWRGRWRASVRTRRERHCLESAG